MSEPKTITMPPWVLYVFVGACGFVSFVIASGIPWAWNVASNLAEIKTQLVSYAQLNDREIERLNQRMSQAEGDAKNLQGRLRDIERSLGVRRSASRPISPE